MFLELLILDILSQMKKLYICYITTLFFKIKNDVVLLQSVFLYDNSVDNCWTGQQGLERATCYVPVGFRWSWAWCPWQEGTLCWAGWIPAGWQRWGWQSGRCPWRPASTLSPRLPCPRYCAAHHPPLQPQHRSFLLHLKCYQNNYSSGCNFSLLFGFDTLIC